MFEWDFSIVIEALPLLLRGLVNTILLTIIVIGLSIPLGLVVALGRLTRFRPINLITYIYTEVMRNIPVLVLVVWVFYVLPVFGITLTAFLSGVLALTLNATAYCAEIFRGGISSVDPGQREAALFTGMTEWQANRRIVLPQGIIRSIPLLAAIWISMFKDTALVAFIGVRELMGEARLFASITFRPMETFTVAAIIYFLITFPQSVLLERLFQRFRVSE